MLKNRDRAFDSKGAGQGLLALTGAMMKDDRSLLSTCDGKANVLIIDDDQQVRGMLRELLCEKYNCAEACSAEEALALIRAKTFDLILSDITMGGLSGLEMVPHVLRLSPDTSVIMISGEQTIERAIEALRVGVFDYIRKPFDLRHVEAAVERALEHNALRRAKRLYENHLEELVEDRTRELSATNASLQDQINRRKRAQQKIHYLVYYDALTGLPNQASFKNALTRELALTRQRNEMLAVLFLSLDRFKKVNDTLGHEAGDRLLCAVSEKLSANLRKEDAVARFGSDEFSLLLTRISNAGDVIRVARDVREALQSEFGLDGHELYVTASIGISLYPSDGENAQTLLKNASAALYRAKRQGGNNYQFYTADMNEVALKQLSLETGLRRAIEREELVVYYQPKIYLTTGRISGTEALVRWQHPELGLTPPAEFIPLAEDTGLIAPLGAWVLHAACAQQKYWQASGLGSFRVSVNLSPRQFKQSDLLEMVKGTLKATGLEPDCLELEVTESSVMEDAESAIRTLRQLKEMGVKISVDDFGTGYSSLSHLKHLPIDILKIDRSFVRDMTSDMNDEAIVMTIINLAHNLGLKVIAEGVETEEQIARLRLLGCDEAQGYLFGRPVPADELKELLVMEKQA